MNCDQVFDVLTQGPFPTGRPIDARVERHIACCHECRQMAEALRPALDLFHESIDELDQMPLPEYQGQAEAFTVATLPEAVEACLNAPELRRRSKVPDERSTRSALGRRTSYIGTAVLAVVGFVLLAVGVLPSTKSALKDITVAAPVSEEQPVNQPQGIALAQLSEACPKTAGIKTRAGTPAQQCETVSRKARCCTLCHNAANRDRPRLESIAMLEKSCSGCHSR